MPGRARGHLESVKAHGQSHAELYSGDERSTVEGLLDWYRDGVIVKVSDLTDEQAWHRASPTSESGF
jgi:hypothetical protein